MNPRVTLATTRRILQQLRRDPRTIALLLVLPTALTAVLRYVFDDDQAVFTRVGPLMLGIFPLATMFVVTSVATLRERTGGTLERLMTTPLAKLDLLLGYALAFSVAAVAQIAVLLPVSLLLLGLEVEGPLWALVLVAVLVAVLGVALGLLGSAFARTEFQAVQMFPALILPQVLLCGLFAPRDSMGPVLGLLSDLMPLSYAVDALRALAVEPGFGSGQAVDTAVIAGVALAALLVGAATLPRRTG
ncbi:ABC transporter permease [Actinocorallia sp. API 0066]|uniref:ABC transporter permease n=1 Tax=Actinocorallia sp. API 0066 TaxID=2896846 RepID=UPI001E5FE7B3|nr:ABC transporter permease [Actinocorallia sp. API 0066]MCD0452258.1 ABC transporter permease [Actinocorallia sp. API 0066]